MENAAPIDLYQININICNECGLPLKIYSYEKNNANPADIRLKLFCQNLSHKKITEIKFELYQKLINDNLNNLCKCVICNQLINNKDNCYYCYDCRKIVCFDCINNNHDKNHKNVLQYENLKNKCLKHNQNDNEINLYCLDCKINMCKYCLLDDIEHSQLHNVKEIKKLVFENTNNINNILQEQVKFKKSRDDMLKLLNNMNNKINFNELLLKEQNKYFHLFNLNNSLNNKNNSQENNDLDLNPKTTIIKNSHYKYKSKNNNNVNNDINNNNNNSLNFNNIQNSLNFNNNYNKDKNETTTINIIYHDENIKYDGMDIINDCQMIQYQTKFPLILTNDIINLNLLLKNLLKNKTKSKFILIVNGASAEKTINFIKMNGYRSLFITACIYTGNINKYLKVKYNYQDFVENIYCDCYAIINFINICFQNLKIYSERFYINQIINEQLYRKEYSILHKELSKFYGDESKEAFISNINNIKTFISNSKEFQEGIKDRLINCFQKFSELSNKNYEEIISCFLNDNNFSKIINSLLMKKEINTYQYISYFVGNLMHCLVQYGKKKNRSVNKGKILYKGLQMNIVDLLEFLKNRGLMITFPHFFSMGQIQYAEISSKRNAPEINRKNKDIYSVILKISYLYDEYFEPSIFEIKDLASYPDEEEYIMLPFTFMTLKKIIIDSNKYTSDIELEVVGKEQILENFIKDNNKNLEYNKQKHIMIVK